LSFFWKKEKVEYKRYQPSLRRMETQKEGDLLGGEKETTNVCVFVLQGGEDS